MAHLEISDRAGAPAGAADDAAFGSAYDAVINAAGVHVLDGRIVVRVVGDDRTSFIHGTCTADVKGARPGLILPALFLTEHAHVIADAFIWVRGDALILDIDSDAWTRTRTHLERLLVADDVEFDHEDYDRERWPVWQEWAAGASRSPSRAIAVERLTLLGILGEG